MADRYQDRPFSDQSSDGDDPLAELARLIGQTDPRSTMGRANQTPNQPPRSRPAPPPPRAEVPPALDHPAQQPSGPLWMQRAARSEATRLPDFPGPEFPAAAPQRQAPAHPAQPAYQQQPVYPQQQQPVYPQQPAYPQAATDQEDADQEQDHDTARYDDALFGRLDNGNHDPLLDPNDPDDGYPYPDGDEEDGDYPAPRRRGLVLVSVVLALAVVGTGGAFAYRTLMGSSRSGEPPIIRADAGPTKIMPASSDNLSKVPDRLGGDGSERIVPREEAPVDVDAGPRVVLPGLNMNAPPAAAVPASTTAAPAPNGTLPNNEPRKIKTFSVRGGDQTADASAAPSNPAPPAKPAATPRAAAPPRGPAANANANASAPLSLVPQQASEPEPRTRVASNPPAAAAAAGSGYMVQLSAQRSETDAMTSYKTLQGKFSTVLGSRQPVIKRADLGDKGIWFRAMVGPFGAKDEATQFCSSLETAGGQCRVVLSN